MFLMMALLVAPAMATVTISLEQVEDECALNLVATADGADTVDGAGLKSLVAGLALNVSVGAGETIDSVINFLGSGVSTAAAPGYGIYMGNIMFVVTDPDGIPDNGDETTDIDQVGSPVAPASAPDVPGQLPGESCVLEFAGLFDVGVPADAPEAVTVLAKINVSDGATVTVSEEGATRGGIVNIGGAAPSGVVMPAPTQADCGPPVPDCWKCPCFEWGDPNCDDLISATDVQRLVGCWGKPYDPCCDFNKDGIVSAQDVQILVASWGSACPEQ